MELQGSQTEKNLWAAFAAESQARNRYGYFADAARASGRPDVADVFEQLAANEAEHAKREFELLGGAGELRGNLERAIQGERLEHEEIYPRFAHVARDEGFLEVADFFERMSKVEGAHERLCGELLDAVDGKTEFTGRTVLRSLTRMAQVTLPGQANPSGFVHGGELMKMVDNAAGVAAVRHSQRSVVLARVADIQFHRPVRVGDLVLLEARVTFVSRSSMEVTVELDSEWGGSGRRNRAVTATLIMVAQDKEGNAVEVPPLISSTEEQEKLYQEGKKRYEAYKTAKKTNE
ncbi:MAG: hypothetical protein HZB55_16300 [Deltaproteobacteria bacterium]|nr:hypothetical protein [Deltaproteobacteria bacterium]